MPSGLTFVHLFGMQTYYQACANKIYQFLHSPFAFQASLLCFFAAFTVSFQPIYNLGGQAFNTTSIYEPYLPLASEGFIRNSIGVNTAGLELIEVVNEEGQITRQMAPRKRDRTIEYVVKSGDNASKIAHRFGLKVSTILWANGLNSRQTLSIGQDLRIPPTDGVFHKVRANDTLGEIAKTYGVELAKIRAYNRVDPTKLRKDQEIFIPEGQKRFIADSNRRAQAPASLKNSSTPQVSSVGLSFIRPTRGIITQRYHRNHLALDIANKPGTPIYASSGGKVSIAKSSGWNYGYGQYVVIDHDQQTQTLYSHLSKLLVSPGDTVKKGEIIGLMGNTGRVFGPTGVHLHFEIRSNGRKLNPLNFFK